MLNKQAETNERVAAEPDCLKPDDIKKRLHRTARKELNEHLVQDECVLIVIEGFSAQAMIVTNRDRVLVFKKGMMSGVTFGRKMYAWNFRDIHGVRVDVRLMNGFVALETTGSDAESISYWKSGGEGAWEAANAIPIGTSIEQQAREGAAALRAMLHRYHTNQGSSDRRHQFVAPPHGTVPVQNVSTGPSAILEPSPSPRLNRFCFACGARLQTGAIFCSACGQKLG